MTPLRFAGDRYTGPVTAAVIHAGSRLPSAIVLLALADDCARPSGSPLVRVRMEIEPEEAEDLIRALLLLVPVAKGDRRDGRR